MILTLKELAAYLRVNERTVMRMLHGGQIQGAKIGGQWRFQGKQIDSLFFPSSAVTPDVVPLSGFTRTHIGIPVSRVMAEERIVTDLQATDGEGVIRELVRPAFLNTLVLDVQDILERTLAREELLSTGVGNGIAIPHSRDPVPTLRVPALIVFGRSKAGVEFGAIDDKPVHVFFVFCCQNIELHLHLMGRLACLLHSKTFVEDCLKCNAPADILRLVLAHERQQFLRSGEPS